MDAELTGMFDIPATVLIMTAVFRGSWLAYTGDTAIVEVWRRRWIEVLGMIAVGVVLFFLGRLAF